MNIFATDNCSKVCAENLDDKRLVKMVLETAQMLSTAVNEIRGFADPKLYKSTHRNHPCNVWARENRSNFNWLLQHGISLANEYTHRYGKVHKCNDIFIYIGSNYLSQNLTPGNLTPFANCAAHKGKNISFKHVDPVTDAYKEYLNARWKTDIKKPNWKNRPSPTWCNI